MHMPDLDRPPSGRRPGTESFCTRCRPRRFDGSTPARRGADADAEHWRASAPEFSRFFGTDRRLSRRDGTAGWAGRIRTRKCHFEEPPWKPRLNWPLIADRRETRATDRAATAPSSKPPANPFPPAGLTRCPPPQQRCSARASSGPPRPRALPCAALQRFETDWLAGSGGFELRYVILSTRLKFHWNFTRH